MPDARDWKAIIEYRYGDRGGIKSMVKIFNNGLPYDDQAQLVKEQYRISISTANKYRARLKDLGLVKPKSDRLVA